MCWMIHCVISRYVSCNVCVRQWCQVTKRWVVAHKTLSLSEADVNLTNTHLTTIITSTSTTMQTRINSLHVHVLFIKTGCCSRLSHAIPYTRPRSRFSSIERERCLSSVLEGLSRLGELEFQWRIDPCCAILVIQDGGNCQLLVPSSSVVPQQFCANLL